MKTRWIQMMWPGLVAGALLGLAAGCGEDAETGTGLNVTPASSTVYADGATVLLTACTGDCDGTVNVATATNLDEKILLPLEWSVVNPAVGRIMASAGYSAVYESYGPRGQNYIIVHDQGGREGLAVVEQRWQEGDPEETGGTPTEEE